VQLQVLLGVSFLLASAATCAAEKCEWLDLARLNQAVPGTAWKLDSGGTGACSFSGNKSQSSFGYSQTVDPSAANAEESVRSSRQTIAETDHVDALPALGKEGFSYSPKSDKGVVNKSSVFFFGYRNSIEISGYLNLKQPVTPAQRDAAAKLLYASMAVVATDSKALAKATDCPYLDSALVKRLLPFDNLSVAVPGPTSCVAFAEGNVISVSVMSGANLDEAAHNMMTDNGCKVEPLPQLSDAAGISYACNGGNPRAQILSVVGGRMFDLTFVPKKEPSAEQRALLIQLAEYAAAH
jgi:hypothetical protein